MGYLESISSYIQSNIGIATDSIFINYLPSSPDTCVTLYTTPGLPPEVKQGYDKPGLQVYGRGATYTAIQTILESIYVLLHGLGSKDINGIHFVDIAAMQSKPIPLGRDEAGRYIFSQNYRCEFRNNTTHRE